MQTNEFLKREDGAVTVDWVVLTAGLVGLGLATMAVVSSGVEDVSGDIDAQLKADDIISASFEPAATTYSAFDEPNYPGKVTLYGEEHTSGTFDNTYKIILVMFVKPLRMVIRNGHNARSNISSRPKSSRHLTPMQTLIAHPLARNMRMPAPETTQHLTKLWRLTTPSGLHNPNSPRLTHCLSGRIRPTTPEA